MENITLPSQDVHVPTRQVLISLIHTGNQKTVDKLTLLFIDILNNVQARTIPDWIDFPEDAIECSENKIITQYGLLGNEVGPGVLQSSL